MKLKTHICLVALTIAPAIVTLAQDRERARTLIVSTSNTATNDLHVLTAETSARQVWWNCGVRDRSNHPFSGESVSLPKELPGGRAYILQRRPDSTDQLGPHFGAIGNVRVPLLEKLGVFLKHMHAGLREWEIPPKHFRLEMFGAHQEI